MRSEDEIGAEAAPAATEGRPDAAGIAEAGEGDRKDARVTPPESNVDNIAVAGPDLGNVDVEGWLTRWDPFNVDNFAPRAARPANVDKKSPWKAGRRMGPMPYHPPQPRPAIPLPEPEREPEGTLADALPPVAVGPEAKAYWADLSKWDASAKADMASLGRALAVLRSTARRTYSARTLKEYERALRRMGDRTPEDMAPECSKRSAYVYRAALLHETLSRRLPDAVTEGRRAAAAMDVGKLAEAAGAARECLAVLDRYPPDREHRTIRMPERAGDSFYEAARAHVPAAFLAPAKPGMGRRSVLSRFPAGWRDLIWRVAEGHRRVPNRHVAAVAALSLVGLRPQEIEDGVFVDATNPLAVHLTVLKPAKSHSGRFGLGPRTHVLAPGRAADPGGWLHAYARRHGGAVVVSMKRRHLARLVGALSRRAMPDVDPVACPYDYRHQFSADAKRAAREVFPGDPEARQAFVAERMGHGSAKSQRAYGTAAQSRGGRSASDEVEILDPARKVKPARPSTPMPSKGPTLAPAAPSLAPGEGPEV